MSWEEPTAVQLRVTLPTSSRRSGVARGPRRFHLGQLHRVIQAAFGWWDSHLHEFRSAGCATAIQSRSASPSSKTTPAHSTRAAVRLRDFGRSDGLSFLYVYDFGDNWQHRVTFERLLAIDPAPRTASCIAGARARPPEDVGGTSGYANFLESSPIPITPNIARP